MRRALFLDRDGVVNIDRNYVFRKDDFEFIEGIFELCEKFRNKNYLIFIITNQAGIARKLYTEEDFQDLTRWMTAEFKARGVEITKVYHCPHHPDFTGNCSCRKPAPGLILQAAHEYELDLENSVLIGDKESDLMAARNAGIGIFLYMKALLLPGENYKINPQLLDINQK